ncbi:MAG: Lrp/AsnC family transcriptional regulator [Candidatus Nitrosocaldaceae archaeon]
MRRPKILDNIDKEILRLVSKDPEITQTKLANALSLTQPAISLRLKKLKKMNILNGSNIIDPSILDIKMIRIDINTNNTSTIIDKVKRCPMIVNCYETDDNTISMIAIGENMQFLNCMLLKHIDTNGDDIIRRNIIKSIKGLSIANNLEQRSEYPPCGDKPCGECEYYIDNGGECVGCPLTIYYKGNLWNDESNTKLRF